MPDIAVSVQAAPVDLRSWLSLARRLESSGFRGLLMGDHPGSGASPWPELRVVREEARLAGTGPVIEALVQVVDVTGNRTAAIDDLSTKIAGATTQDLARTPFLLIGSHEEMAAQILSQAEELGITRYVIREAAVPALDRVLDLIASPGRLPPSATFG